MQRPRKPDEAIVLVTSTNPKKIDAWGTAFVIYSESASTYLVTCAHVISEVGGSADIKAGDRPATVVASGEDQVDIAVLRVDGQLDKPPLPLSSVAPSGSSFRLYGITKLTSQFVESLPLSGTLGRAVTVFCRGSLMGHKAWELKMDSACKLQRGQSGSPVLTEDGKCVAIAALSKGQGESGIAISIDVLRHIWPDRPEAILPHAAPSGGAQSTRRPPANLSKEVDGFERMVSGLDYQTKVIIICAGSGMGKTRLIAEYLDIATHYERAIVSKNFTQEINIDDFLLELAVKIGFDDFTNFCNWRRNPRFGSLTVDSYKEYFHYMAVNFFDDLLQLNKATRLVILIDQYEKADKMFKEWFGGEFLPKIGLVPQLLLVVAGQEEAAPYFWGPWIQRFRLQKPSPECWVDYSGRRISPEKVQGLYTLCDGLPHDLATILQALPLLES